VKSIPHLFKPKLKKLSFIIPNLTFSVEETLSLRSLLFLILSFFLCIRLHEYSHIFAAAMQNRSFSSEFGRVVIYGGKQVLTSAGGPLFSYIIMWIGLAILILSNRINYTGFVLIFASCPLFRLTNIHFTNFIGGKDELKIAEALHIPYPIALLLLFSIVLPALFVAYFSIKSKFRILWFFFFFTVIPLIAYSIIYIGDKIIIPMTNDPQFVDGLLMYSFHGIPIVVILFDIVVTIGLLYIGRLPRNLKPIQCEEIIEEMKIDEKKH